MPAITIDVSEKVLAIMKKHDMTPEEVFDYGFDLLSNEIPTEETLGTMRESELDEGAYTAKDEDDLFRSLGVAEWRNHI
jgi:hypothetical protein